MMRDTGHFVVLVKTAGPTILGGGTGKQEFTITGNKSNTSLYLLFACPYYCHDDYYYYFIQSFFIPCHTK